MLKKNTLLVMVVCLLTVIFAGVSFAQEAQAPLVAAPAAISPKVADAMAALQRKMMALGVASVKEGALYFGSTKVDENSTMVDDIKAAKGCGATLFLREGDNYVRVSTTVMLEGKRAVGTALDARGKAYKKITKGEPFYGVVDVVGKKYDAGYEPIKDASGAVIGAYYIGFAL